MLVQYYESQSCVKLPLAFWVKVKRVLKILPKQVLTVDRQHEIEYLERIRFKSGLTA